MFETLALAVSLGFGFSMDAFAVSMCKGLSVQKLKPSHTLITGSYFGIFQGVMPALGYLLAFKFEALISSVSHWIAFILLALIGANMIKESLSKCCEEELNASFGFRAMLPLAIATSIDAMVGGVSFAMDKMTPVTLAITASTIAAMTFTFSAVGVKIGHTFGAKYKSKAELVGGIVLIGIGLYSLISGLVG